jgi:hypothetical protein
LSPCLLEARTGTGWVLSGTDCPTLDDVLREVAHLCPEPFEPAIAAERHGWSLAAVRRCLVDLERACIVKFLPGDRWLLRETEAFATDAEVESDTPMPTAPQDGATTPAVLSAVEPLPLESWTQRTGPDRPDSDIVWSPKEADIS